VLQRIVRQLLEALTLRLAQGRSLGLLIAVLLLATACSGSATPISLEPATTSPSTGVGQPPSTSPSLTEPRASAGQHVEFEHFAGEEGLSGSAVRCILQDSKGFIWFGTNDGLSKYDGYSLTVYEHDPENPNSLSHNYVRAIHKDRSGVLWIGTHGGGLDQFDRENEQFIHYQHNPEDPHSLASNRVRSVHEDQFGMLWIGMDGGGLDRFDRENGSFIHYQHDPDDPHSLSNNHVRSIHEDRSGVLWIGTHGGGLDRFDRENEQFIHYQHDPDDPHSLSNNRVWSIYEDRSGVLWIGTWDGLDAFERQEERFIHHRYDPADPRSLSSNRVWSIYEDRAGVLWIGTWGGGLDTFDREKGRFFHHQHDAANAHSLSHDTVWSVYEDRSGVLWVGTGGGLDKVEREKKQFTHYQSVSNDPQSLSHNRVWSIFEDRSGALWVGTSGGLDKIDRSTNNFAHYYYNPIDPQVLSHNNVWSIYEDRSGILWIGTWSGLDRFDREKERFIHHQNDPNDPHSLSNNRVWSIHEDQSGVLWIGTGGGGLDEFDRSTEHFVSYQHDPNDPTSLSHNNVRIVYEDRSGTLWIGTDGGLDRLDRASKRFFHYRNDANDPHSLSHNNIWSVYEDRAGALWIGTNGGGLDKLDRETETFIHYTERNGLPNDVVYGILEDDQGYLWLSTNNGLSKFDPRTETFRNYDVSDGLQSSEFSPYAYHRSKSGELFFGGINGLNAFYPDNVRDNPYIPPVVLTSLTQAGEDVDLGKAVESVREVTFHWPKNSFEFEFAALSYTQSERNQYAYRLEGFEKDWHYLGTRRFGGYTNLPGNRYTLRVIGSNNDGVWNREGLSIRVTIVPPFWATWWFRGLVALALIGSAVGGYRLRVRSIEAQSRELETLVEQRTYEIERRRQELEALYRADAELHRHLSLDEVLQALVDITVDILQADKSSLMVCDEKQGKLVVRVARGFRPETLAQMYFLLGEGTAGHVAATGEPVIVEDTRTDSRIVKRSAIVEPEGIRSFMQVPIKVGGEVFGVFSADYAQPRAFGDDEQRLFIALAQRAALAIDTAQLYEQSQQLVVVQERNRLARELHDAVTQTLFSASLIAEALPPLWESDQAEGRQLLQELRQLSRGALAEMRTLLLELRPAALVEAGLGDLLRQLGEAVTGRKGVPVTVSVGGEHAIPDDVHVALYRIAQEALNNVVKHARASQVTVSLRHSPPAGQEEVGAIVELCISDNGRGFDPGCVPSDRLGLGIIRERAQAIGASVKIDSQPGHGTQVTVVWKEDE